MERINSGEMPPKKEKVQPPAEESAKVVEWLASRMKEGEAGGWQRADGCLTTGSRATEYVNTRDLIGVHYDCKGSRRFSRRPRNGIASNASARC